MELCVRTKCETCGGSGIIYSPRCDLCGEPYDPSDIANTAFWGSSRMPCGHNREHLIEEHQCSACNGYGYTQWWMGFDQMVLEILKRRESEWPDAFRTELEARHEQGGESHGSEVPLRETARLQGAS